jgi:acyl-CoA reductase-like NAD-dependent aldehyde dehydrogenase
MAIAQEEVFGPVVAVLPFRDEDEAIRLANATTYGLTAAVWTTDIKRALRVVGRLAAGTVWVNAVQVLTPTAPFGGMKASGLGRELGRVGLESYQEVKTVIVDGNDWPLRYF